MLGVVLSGNVLQLAFFWELTSLFSFLLIGYWDQRKDAQRGARMALGVTAAGGLCLLAGVLVLAAIAGAPERDGGAHARLCIPALGDAGESGRVPARAPVAGALRHGALVLPRRTGRSADASPRSMGCALPAQPLLAFDSLYTSTMLVIMALGRRYRSSSYFEAALLIALFGLVGSTAMTVGATLGTWSFVLATIAQVSFARGQPSVHAVLIAVFIAVTASITTIFLLRAAIFRQRIEMHRSRT